MTSQSQGSIEMVVQLLEDDNLMSHKEIKRALQKVTKSLTEIHYHAFFKALLSPPPSITHSALELLLSNSESGQTFAIWLCNNFPESLERFSDSIHALILKRISLFLHFLNPFERSVSIRLHESRSMVEYSAHVIQTLVESNCTPSDELQKYSDEDGEFVVKKRAPKRRKGKKVDHKVALDSKLVSKAFEAFGLELEDIVDNKDYQMSVVYESLKGIFKIYLDILRHPKVEASLLEAYICRDRPDVEADGQSVNNASQVQEISESIEIPAAYPMVQPMKAALYFESAEGFGEWRILISTRADRDLREARRKDAKYFRIIIKKIKELSNGHFSDDNQKRLNGPNTEIPIFEAKMTRDSRLIYQVDCIPEYDADVERQVIKIFGVYTHAQIDKRLWDSVGHQLGKKGKVYRQRCAFRNQPKVAGDKVFTPACFPPPEKVEEDGYVIPELPQESLEEMHSVLVLEKFISFSQALLNSIIADLDVAHVFNVSTQEKEIIEYPHSCYVLGRSGTGKTTTMLFKMLGIERAFLKRKDTMQKPRQIFVTQSRVLAGKVEEYFAKLLESLATAERTREELAQIVKSKRLQTEENGLIDVDDDHNWRGDLPQKYSELQDQHFPLFVTFDRLSSLLEADIRQNSSQSSLGGSSSQTTNHLRDIKSITYQAFLETYWPRFSQSLTKGLDPALVFSEMMGVIQGSEESLSYETRYLDKKAYENLSHRAQYAFAKRREVIYSIFAMYLKQKKQRNEFDSADRTHQILKAFQSDGIPGQKIDYLYVDEAQDNLLIDALMLRSLVRNPDGLFWAGDTAQTISVGSSFRFNDLKAFLFRLEKRREEFRLGNEGSISQEPPRTFQLAMNYRSHGGIVQCAHSVIELITEFWPYAIDILSREKGVVDGSKPVFFSGWDSDTVRYEQFLFGESGNPIEFGAQQCILVRDDAAREELRQQVGDIGLIMTLYESKGLEFDDVLLYKFFEDSTVDLSQWRVVLNLLEDQSGQDVPAPRFDDIKHAGVCSELKFLYVAITRARKNLWLVDCSEKSEPMREFWLSRNEVQNCTPGTDVPRLAVSSSPEEWEKSGRTLFLNKRYLQAMHCFERAGMTREVAVSRTYYLREQARSISSVGSRQGLLARYEAFLVAAEAFVECSAAATNLKEKRAYLRAAADCFEEGNEDFKAAKAYEEAEEYNSAIKLYRKCAKFDEAVAIVMQNRDGVDTEVAQNMIDVARLFYFKGGELEKATHLFDSVEEQLEYLEDFDLDISRAALLEKLGKFSEAAEIHLEEGRTMEAIRLFLMDATNEASIKQGITCVLGGLWEKISFGTRDINGLEGVTKLLDLASKIKSSIVLDPFVADELLMFQSIKSHDTKTLLVLGKRFADKKKITSAVMCLDIVFSTWPNMYSMTAADISELLEDFSLYCRLMQHIAYLTSPCSNIHIRKLFNITQNNENAYLLRQNTFLYESVLGSRVPVVASNDQGVFVSEWDLSRKFREFILVRLTSRIMEENASCKEAQAFSPCLPYLVNDYCGRNQCPRQHVASSSLTKEWYNLQVRIHFQQIIIIQILCAPPCHPVERTKNISYWINRIYETMHPAWFSLGGMGNYDSSLIPEASRALQILRTWCYGILYWTNHRLDQKLFTILCQVNKIFVAADRVNAPRLVCDSPLSIMFRDQPNYSHKLEGGQVPVVTMLSTGFSEVSNTSLQWGVLFIQHVLDNLLPIDANVLCTMIEHLCGSAVLVRSNRALHNVNLPLSWFRALFPNVKNDPKLKPVDVNPTIDKLVKALKQLINSLHMGVEAQIGQLSVEKSNLGNPSLIVFRGIFISRLCRALCFVGYNINNSILTIEILKTLKSLKSGVKPHKAYTNYAYIREARDISRLISKSTNGSPLDEVIQLYHESKVVPSLPPPPLGIRRLIYKTLADIPRLLANPHAIVSNLRADAPVFVPRPRLPQVEDAETEQDVEEPEVDNTDIIDTAPSAESFAISAIPTGNTGLSEEQTQAAVKLQARYRKVMRYRREIPKNNIDASRNSNFEVCLAESRKIQWPDKSFYRMLFLGPLPHVLVCLNAAHAWAVNTKKRNKKRFTSASHQDLEDIKKRLTDQKILLDEIRHLQKVLNPTSEFHRKRDVEELKKKVLGVEALVGKLGPNAVQGAKDDMAIGLKGIVAVRKIKTKPKPPLRIDDADDGYDDYEADGTGSERGVKKEVDVGNDVEERAIVVHEYEKEAALEVSRISSNLQEKVPAAQKEGETVIQIQSLPWATFDSREDKTEPEHSFEESEVAYRNGHSYEELEVEYRNKQSYTEGKYREMQSLSWYPI